MILGAETQVESRKMLAEAFSSTPAQSGQMDIVDETGVKKKHWYLDGIFIQGEIRNLNGRIYPRHEIERAINKLSEDIRLHGAVLGELDHPDTLNIQLQNVSHAIESISMKGNDGCGRMRILPGCEKGKVVESFLAEKVPLGVSSRGSGEVDEYTSRVSDYEIVTIDIVATPSAQDARPTPIYEKLMRTVQGQKILNNARDSILSGSSTYDKALHNDIVSFIKNWKYNG